MKEIELRVRPQGQTLGDFYNDRSRVSLIMGPLGSGKTITACQKLLKLMTEQEPNPQGVRPSRWLAIRNSYPDLQNTTIKDWIGLFGDLGQFTNGAPPRHVISVELDDGTRVESELIFLALDRPQDVKKLRGVQATGFWLNETKELSRATVDMADLRHGRFPSMAVGGVNCTYHGMIGDSNAWDEDHWLFETISGGTTPDGWSFFRQPGGVLKTADGWVENSNAENLHNLPPDYYIAGLAGKREDWILVNLANNYGVVQEGKSVWPEFIDLVHTAPKELHYDARFPLFVGIDFGLTPAAVFMQRTPMGQYQVIEEIVTENMGASRLAGLIKERLAAADYSTLTVTGDPAGDQRAQTDERTPFDILAANGLSAEPADTNDPLIRIEAVAQQLSRMTMDGKPGLIISPTCKKLRKAMAGGYCYKRVQVAGDEKYHDKPDKNMSSHIADSLQYCVLGAGCGDSVVGNSSWQPSNRPFNPDDFIAKGVR